MELFSLQLQLFITIFMGSLLPPSLITIHSFYIYVKCITFPSKSQDTGAYIVLNLLISCPSAWRHCLNDKHSCHLLARALHFLYYSHEPSSYQSTPLDHIQINIVIRGEKIRISWLYLPIKRHKYGVGSSLLIKPTSSIFHSLSAGVVCWLTSQCRKEVRLASLCPPRNLIMFNYNIRLEWGRYW